MLFLRVSQVALLETNLTHIVQKEHQQELCKARLDLGLFRLEAAL